MRGRFENRMTRTQTALGWCWLPVHIVLLPVLLKMYAIASGGGLSGTEINLIYYGVSFVFVLIVMFRFLRAGFDALLDRPGRCVLAAGIALCAEYALSMLCALLLLALRDAANPNNAATVELAAQNPGVIRALALFIAPIVEEPLFRGVAFGALRTRSRVLAYLVSTLLFGLYHVWQYALAYADAGMLLYAVQYVPVSLALAWCYDRTESIWTPIFVHTLLNAASFAALSM